GYASKPSALTNRNEPAAIVTVDGFTSRLASAPGTISTFAAPVWALGPEPVVAVTTPLPVVVDAVKTPDAVIVPIPPATLHVKVAPGIGLSYRSSAPAPNVSCPPAPTKLKPSMPPAWSPTTRYPSANATDDELPRGASGSCCSNLPVEASHAYRFPSHVLTNTVPLLYAGEVPMAPPGMKLSQTTA